MSKTLNAKLIMAKSWDKNYFIRVYVERLSSMKFVTLTTVDLIAVVRTVPDVVAHSNMGDTFASDYALHLSSRTSCNYKLGRLNTLVQSWFFWLGTHFWVSITFGRVRYNVRLIIIKNKNNNDINRCQESI